MTRKLLLPDLAFWHGIFEERVSESGYTVAALPHSAEEST